jgi:hypothetical protein
MIGANPWAITFHWKNGSSTVPWTQADLDLLCLTTYNAVTSAWQANLCTNTNWTEVDGTDLTNAAGVGSVYTHAIVSGTLSSPFVPSGAAQVVQNRIAARYRGGHPRTFWPPANAANQANEYQWTTSRVGLMATAQTALVGSVRAASYSFGAGTLNHVIPRYTYSYTDDPVHHKWIRTRTGLLSVDVVQAYFGQTKIGSQRKRMVI